MTSPENRIMQLMAQQRNGNGDQHLGGPSLNSLNPMRRAFVIAYVLGDDEVRGIAYKSYIAAGYTASNNNVASAAAYQVLQDQTVKEAILELNTAIDTQARARLKSWSVLAAKAQNLLDKYLDTLEGKRPESPVLLSANAITVIKEVLDRGQGKVTQPVEHDIGSRLDNLIKEIAGRKKPRTITATVPAPPVKDADIESIENPE